MAILAYDLHATSDTIVPKWYVPYELEIFYAI